MADNRKGAIALITGANKGIGYEVARQLGEQGSTVLVAARSAELGEAATRTLKTAGADAHFVELDVTKPETINSAAETIGKQYGRLDILVNNAGIVAKGDGAPGVADIKAVREVFEINVFGVLAVTQAMLPLIRKSTAGRIVMVSSGLGSIALNADPNGQFSQWRLIGYNGSKAIMSMMTVLLAGELHDTSIKVNAVNPGYTATDMNGNSGTQTVAEGAAEIVRQALAPDSAPTGGFFQTSGPLPW